MPIETFAQPANERGWSAIPTGAPEWALKMITEYRSAVQRGEHRAIVITPKAGDLAPMVRAVHGGHPVERRSVTKFVGKKKKKWTGPTAHRTQQFRHCGVSENAPEHIQEQYVEQRANWKPRPVPQPVVTEIPMFDLKHF